MANNTNKVTYTFTEFTNACRTTFDASMAAMAVLAQNYLCNFFFPQLPARAQSACDKPIVMKREHIHDYISSKEKENRTVTLDWPHEDITTQVMFFIVGCLKGVPVLYTNNKDVNVQNHLVKPDSSDLYYKVAMEENEGGKKGVIIVDLAVGLPSGFYDPAREAVRAAQNQAAEKAAAATDTLPESNL